LGRRGEQLAEQFLRNRGFAILDRNVQNRHGEIDLIAVDQQTLVFIEVRTRSGTGYGTPAESITWRKRRKLRELALAYLQEGASPFRQVRFDVVGIVFKPGSDVPHISHIPNAF